MVASMWFFMALGAAILWGLGYAMTEKLLDLKMTPSFILLLTGALSLPFYVSMSLLGGELKSGFELFKTDMKVFVLTIACVLCYVVANYLILYSIVGKNATLASLIEISYPIFTIFFVWLLFGKFDLNSYTIAGGALILAGVGLIYLKA